MSIYRMDMCSSTKKGKKRDWYLHSTEYDNLCTVTVAVEKLYSAASPHING